MAYYMRSNSASSHGNYMMSNSSMQGGYLMHSAKGSEWKGPHKYIDKRWIQGAWHYLYEIPKEYAQRAGEAVKDTAEKAASTVKNTAQKATQAARDFRNYSKETDAQLEKAQKDLTKARADAEKAHNRASQAYQHSKEEDKKNQNAVTMGQYASKLAEESQKNYKENRAKAEDRLAKAKAYEQSLTDRIHNGGVVNQKEWQDAKKQVSDAKQAIKDLDEQQKQEQEDIRKLNENKAKEALATKKRSDLWLDKREEEYKKYGDALKREDAASEEKQNAIDKQETLTYKASKALDDIIEGADNISAQGAQWLKNQLEAGNKWAMNTLADIEEKGSSAIATGSAFLKNLFGKKTEAPVNSFEKKYDDPIGPTKPSETSEKPKTNGRKYEGTGKKAEKRGWSLNNNDRVTERRKNTHVGPLIADTRADPAYWKKIMDKHEASRDWRYYQALQNYMNAKIRRQDQTPRSELRICLY